MTKEQIQRLALKYINRSDDTLCIELVPTWFQFAHRDIQRRHNFRGMNIENNIAIPIVNNVDAYNLPSGFKHPYMVYLWNNDTSKILKFLVPTELRNIKQLRQSRENVFPETFSPDAFYYAIWNGQIHLYPTPGTNTQMLGHHIGMDYYRYLPLPADTVEDWFGLHASDLLLYQTLIESLVVVGTTEDSRPDLYKMKIEEIFTRFRAEDIEQQLPGPIRVRG